MIKEKLGWAPSIPVAEGLKKTYFWIKDQVEKDKAAGIDITKLGTSEIVVQTTDDLDELAAQGLAGKCCARRLSLPRVSLGRSEEEYRAL